MIEGFRFSLQSVLDISINEEEECKTQYEKALYELNTLLTTLKDLNSAIISNSGIANIGDIGMLHLKRNYLNSLEFKKKQVLSSIDIKKTLLATVQKEYIEKQLDRQMVESMRDRELDEYTTIVDLEEQARNDEFALYSYVKNK